MSGKQLEESEVFFDERECLREEDVETPEMSVDEDGLVPLGGSSYATCKLGARYLSCDQNSANVRVRGLVVTASKET